MPQALPASQKAAAFYDVDGTLIKTNIVHAFAWYARHQPTLGLGEASLGPTAAAIGNAVARALGRRIRALPLTRERIMATLLAEN